MQRDRGGTSRGECAPPMTANLTVEVETVPRWGHGAPLSQPHPRAWCPQLQLPPATGSGFLCGSGTLCPLCPGDTRWAGQTLCSTCHPHQHQHLSGRSLVPARWEQGGCCTTRHGEQGWSPWMLGGHASHGEGEEGSSCLLQQCRGGGCSGVQGGHSNYRAQTGLGGTGQDQLLLIPAHPGSSRACFNATRSSTSALPRRSRGSCPAAAQGRGLTRRQSQPRLRRCRCSAGPGHCARTGAPALTRPTNSSGCGRSTAAPPARPGHRSCKRVSSSSDRRRLSRPPSWVPPWWASPG